MFLAVLWIRIRKVCKFLGLPDPSLFLQIQILHHQAKKVGKTLISTVLWLLYDFLSLKTYVNVPSKSTR